MAWQQTYASFLRHEDYPESEVEEWVEGASRIVNQIPEPYRRNLVARLNGMSRDDMCTLDFDTLAATFGIAA